MRLIPKLLLVAAGAFVGPLVLVWGAYQEALTRVEGAVSERVASALEPRERARLELLAQARAATLGAELARYEAEVEHLRHSFVHRMKGPRIPYEGAYAVPGTRPSHFPPAGSVHPDFGAFADWGSVTGAAPWLPKQGVLRAYRDQGFQREVGRSLEDLLWATPLLAGVKTRHDARVDLAWIVLTNGATNVQPPYRYSEVVAEDPSIVDLDENTEDYVRLLTKEAWPSRGARWLTPYLDRFNGLWMTSSVAPLDVGGQFRGTVGVDLLLGTMTGALREGEGGGVRVVLCDQEGHPIAAEGEDIRAFFEAGAETDLLLRALGPGGGGPWTEADHRSLRALRFGMGGSAAGRALGEGLKTGRGVQRIELSSGPVFAAFARVPGPDWRVAVLQGTRSVERPIGEVRHAILTAVASARGRAGTGLILGAFAMFFVLVLLQRWTIRPLDRLGTWARDLRPDRLEPPPIDTGGDDEIAVLQRRFGEMVGTLVLAQTEARDGQVRQQEVAGKLRAAVESLEREVVHRQRALAALAEEEERSRVTLSSIDDGVIVVEATGATTLLNPAAARLLRVDPGDGIGQPVTALLRIEDEAGGALDPLAVDARKTVRITGRNDLLRIHRAPFQSEQGGQVLVLEDVTERARFESELARLDKLEGLRVLAAGIAHDFNNLLLAILGNLSLLSARQGAEVDPVLASAERATDRARDLCNQLLTFASGGVPIRRIVALDPLTRDAATFVQRGKRWALRWDIAPDLWPVEVDPSQIGQVVQNLVLNAAQAMGETGTVTVRLSNTRGPLPPGMEPGAAVILDVEDEGPGVTASVRTKLFDPFFTTRPGGRGLGLSVCHSIATRHGGHIEVGDAEPSGARFRLWLPACPGAQVGPARADRGIVRGHGRVVVLDDEPAIRDLLGRLLPVLGYEASCFEDGAQVLQAVRAAGEEGRPFRAALLDLTVPGGMGGIECAERLRELAPELPIILSTGYSEDAPAMATRRSAVLLPKPYRLADLAEALTTRLDGPRPEPGAGDARARGDERDPRGP